MLLQNQIIQTGIVIIYTISCVFNYVNEADIF